MLVVNPESLLNPEIAILPLVNFLCTLDESTTAKKSPSPSVVEVVNSDKSTFTVMFPDVVTGLPETSIKLPAVIPTDVTVPVFVVKPLSLLNILNPISEAAFLLSAPASKTINSSVPTIAAVISVNSDKSTARDIVPDVVTVPPPLSPVPAVIPTDVTVPPPPVAAMVIEPAPFVMDIPLPAVKVDFASVLPVVFPMRSWPLV